MPPQRLFGGPSIAAIRSQAISGAAPHVRRLTEGQLLGNSPDALAQYVADLVMGYPVELDTEGHQIDPAIVSLPESDDSAADVPPAPDGVQPAMDVVQLSLHIPCSGTGTIFKTQPSCSPSTRVPEATLAEHEVVITVFGKPGEDGQEAETTTAAPGTGPSAMG